LLTKERVRCVLVNDKWRWGLTGSQRQTALRAYGKQEMVRTPEIKTWSACQKSLTLPRRMGAYGVQYVSGTPQNVASASRSLHSRTS